jgi:hypothetical protein
MELENPDVQDLARLAGAGQKTRDDVKLLESFAKI